ncbi:MAG: hypothetical protein MN733_43470 [Nitrososphaera sp.]|nr:hypothetical protein [Nitrososphaera sp.]
MTKKTLDATAITNELKGQSVYFRKENLSSTPPSNKPSKSGQDKTTKVGNSRTSELPELPTSQVLKSGTTEVPKLQSYELRNFDALRRLDVRLTGEQKRFLDEMEENIRQQMPEGERNNPDSKRITKNAIIRVFVEIFRQLGLPLNAKRFKNENDLLETLFKALLMKIPELRTSEVAK